MESTGNWSNIITPPPASLYDYSWDPAINGTVYCYTANEHNLKYYLVPIYEIIGPILVTLCALSVIGNTAVLLTVFYMRKKHLTPTLMFSLSLAGADAVAALSMGLGFFVNNMLQYNFNINVPYRDCIVLLVETFRLATMVCSALHFVVQAVNHWMGITKPLHYASRMTRKTAVMCIIVMWVLPVIVFFAYFSLVPGQGFQSTRCEEVEFAHHYPFRAFVSALFFTPLAIMSLVYLHVFYEIQHHQTKFCGVTGSADEKRRMQGNTRALITTLIILLTYLIGWLPAVINYLIVCKDCLLPLTISLCIRLPVNIVTNLLIILKFLVDPVIYTARIPEVRMVIKYFLERIGCRIRPRMDETQRTFDRFGTSSRTGSLMTSLRYSTYRARKESDSSAQYNCSMSTVTPTRKGQQSHHLLTVGDGTTTTAKLGGSVRRVSSTGSNGYPAHSMKEPASPSSSSTQRSSWSVPQSPPPAYLTQSPLIEVSESPPITTPEEDVEADEEVNMKFMKNGDYGTINKGRSG